MGECNCKPGDEIPNCDEERGELCGVETAGGTLWDTVLALDIFPHHSFPENGVECARKQAHAKFQSGFKCQCLPQIQHYVAVLESGTLRAPPLLIYSANRE